MVMVIILFLNSYKLHFVSLTEDLQKWLSGIANCFVTFAQNFYLYVVGAPSPNAPKIDKCDVEDTEGVAGIQPLGGEADKDAVHALNREKYQLGF